MLMVQISNFCWAQFPCLQTSSFIHNACRLKKNPFSNFIVGISISTEHSHATLVRHHPTRNISLLHHHDKQARAQCTSISGFCTHQFYLHWSCHQSRCGSKETGAESPRRGSSCVLPGWGVLGTPETVPPPLFHSSQTRRDHSRAGLGHLVKTHPGTLWSAVGIKRGEKVYFLACHPNNRRALIRTIPVSAPGTRASQQQELPALPDDLLHQSLLQAEELQLEQKSSQRHTLQQKSLWLTCNENRK